MDEQEALSPLVGGHLDTVSFVMDYVEFRVSYNVLRCMTNPIVTIGETTRRFPEPSSRDALCQLIDSTVAEVDVKQDRIELRTDSGYGLVLPLDDDSRTGPEAVHLVPADERGRLDTARMWIW